MRWSQAFIPTLKEDPADAEVVSHRLMVRAGLMRKLSAGIYTYLPLGWRVIHKVMAIIREEHDRAGAHELLMPVLHPAELWKETRRWEVYGPELMRLKDRHSRDFALGPTHEEVITDLVRHEVRSYRQLPLVLYQIQTKFRDEVRPRFGVMRAREFIMKDAYSFHVDEASLDETYWVMHEVYRRIFTRCGLTFRPVEAHTGAIGGAVSHEFMVLAETGETEVLSCVCGYAATQERAEWGGPRDSRPSEKVLRLEKVHTPGLTTVEEVSSFLRVEPRKLVKTLLYLYDGELVAVLVRGDRQLNEAKLFAFLGGGVLRMATPELIREKTGAEMGFSGPVDLEGARLIADYSVAGLGNFVTGANQTDYHLVNVNLGRDLKVAQFADLLVVEPGDPCPRCGEGLNSFRGIEVGQIFKLETKYSQAMGATFLDEKGERTHFAMGCYGIGVTRVVAAAIEQHHDERGIIWPLPLAPFEVEVLAVNMDQDPVAAQASAIYEDLKAHGVEVLLDDREERPGSKFKDADLIGIPLRVVVGERGLKAGRVEVGWWRDPRGTPVPAEKAVEQVMTLLKEAKQAMG